MADLKEQMLKAGLITEDQAKRATHKQRQDNKQLGREGRERKKQQARTEAERQARAKAQTDRKNNQQREQQRQQKEAQQQSRQKQQSATEKALRDGRVANWEGGRTYYFADAGEVRSLQVNDSAAKLLETGKAAIVRDNGRGRYTLLVAGAARELAATEPKRVVTFHQA